MLWCRKKNNGRLYRGLLCGIVGAIPRLTQMVGLPRNCIFLKWSEREMRLREENCSAYARDSPEGLEWLDSRSLSGVCAVVGKYIQRVDGPVTVSSRFEELGFCRGGVGGTVYRPRMLRSLHPGLVFSGKERSFRQWPARSLEKKRRREEPDYEGSGRAVLAPWQSCT